jgi:hypothetical protein
MSVHPVLTMGVYIGAAIFFLAVITYWIVYTRSLKTRAGVGKNEGIAMPTQRKERNGRTGTIS